MNVFIKLFSGIREIRKILKIFKSNHQKILFTKKFDFFEFFKGIYVKEHSQAYMCTQIQVDILKIDRVLLY